MKTKNIAIDGLPAILWGPASDSLFIAVHGDQSHKADAVIGILAERAIAKGCQVLSFDLPEHGERKSEPRLCKVQNCLEDLKQVLKYARSASSDIGLFACSLGAYFSMQAYRDEPIKQALFLSPVVDMERIIKNMLTWFGISEQRLEREQEIATPVKTLYWDYYQYVLKNPVQWNKPTALLYGARDNLCELEYVRNFAEKSQAKMTIMEDGEHFFHTPDQLAFFNGWLSENILNKAVS